MDRPEASGGRGDQHERSARAAAGHPRTGPDLDGLTGDERTLVAMLGQLADATAPDQEERARIRERVLAGLADRPATISPTTKPKLPRPSATRPNTGRTSRPPRGPRSEDDRSRGSSARGRFAIAAVAVLCLVLALGGMSLLLSRDALPGDALYGIKRTAEAASLGLTFGDQQKAFKHLEFATSRVNEMEALAQRYGPQDAPTGGYLSALTDFDTDASAGSRQLIALTTRADGTQLNSLGSWARQQAGRLAAIAPRLPDSVRGRETTSLQLVDAIVGRADALAARLPCTQITSGNADDIGALPATTPCRPLTGTGTPGQGSVSTEPGRPQQSQPGQPTVTTAPVPGTGATPGQPGQPGPSSAPSVTPPVGGGVPTIPGAPAPSTTPPSVLLPLPLPPITVGPLLPGLPGLQVGAG